MEDIIDLKKGFYGPEDSPEVFPAPNLPHKLKVILPSNKILRGARDFDPTYMFYGSVTNFNAFKDKIKRLHLMEITYNELVEDLNKEYQDVQEYLLGFRSLIIKERNKLGSSDKELTGFPKKRGV